MKKLLYSLLAVSIIFSACEEEDTAPTVSAPAIVNGCMDPAANNYNSSATNDDGSCIYPAVSIVGYWNSFEWTIIQNEGYWTTYPNGQKVITNTQSQTNNFWLDLYFAANGDGAGIDEDGSVMPTDWIKNGDTLLMDVYNFTISTLDSSYLTLELFESDTNTIFSNPINDTIYFTDRSELFKFERD